jgi:FemAB-related protein (PEP-CTERM system-associated)
VNERAAGALLDRAGALADELRVRSLELRHEEALAHPLLSRTVSEKVQMRLALPATSELLWKGFKPEVRNLVRNGEKRDLQVEWAGVERLNEFYDIFARNMRDLGTPVFSKRLFAAMLRELGERAEICLVLQGGQAICAAILIHGDGVTEVPSASSLREHRKTNCNMLMYWHLLQRAIERGQEVFDFGRSTIDSPTYKFKKQWGAVPSPTAWQYYVRRGDVGDVRPENPKYKLFIALWQKLPLWLTRQLGPWIVKGIP